MRKKILCYAMLLAPFLAFTQKREPWIDKPSVQWPTIALTNHVCFKNGDRYVHPSFKYAATGFLIDMGKDTLAATAKHVIWIAKNKQSSKVELNQALQQWSMKPKGNNLDSAIIGQLLNEDPTEILEGKGSSIMERDWLVFSVKSSSPRLYPLKPRFTPVQEGEKVYVLGCAYDDSLCTVQQGTVLRKQGLDILIQRDLSVPIGGTSGSPVIDANGYLIGIQSSTTSDGPTGIPVSIAVSTEYLQAVLLHKKSLNAPKRDYGALILQRVLDQGVRPAIELYQTLTKDPQSYYVYNLRSANRNGLRETGEKLIALNKYQEAIAILQLNIQENTGYFDNYNWLAKAFSLAGNKTKAIETYQQSLQKHAGADNEAHEELKKLQTAEK